ncbi:hypothetical protein VNO80_19472 [Phaseolus coccineus]|uniref:Uncharacterized protein n=1 Tax=Phaseolus coccineus TaxID=3886 RepID=A0AAN9MG69_PHACN
MVKSTSCNLCGQLLVLVHNGYDMWHGNSCGTTLVGHPLGSLMALTYLSEGNVGLQWNVSVIFLSRNAHTWQYISQWVVVALNHINIDASLCCLVLRLLQLQEKQ